MKGRKRNKSERRNVTLAPPIKPKGDHGPDTAAQRAGTVMEDVDGPNNVKRVRRIPVYETMKDKLSQAAFQAAEEIYNAYEATKKSGAGGLSDKVDRWPNPTAAATASLEITERYIRSMKAVPQHGRYVVVHVCHEDRAISKLSGGGKDNAMHTATFKAALESAAFKLGYS